MNLNYVADAPAFSMSRKKKGQKSIALSADPVARIKQGIWLYFLLLIFEGALRKWILPGLATPLLLVRDPVAIWLLVMINKQGLFPWNYYVKGMWLLGILGTLTAVFLGHGNLMVAIFGARILMIYFPLIFVIGRIFNRADVVKMGIATLWISLPMIVLIGLQFYTPQSSWFNRGVGGNMEGAGFDGALGFFRPPGTFSFNNGTSLFFSFLACFVLYFWLDPRGVNRLLLVAATGALLASIPLSISRALFFQILVSVLFAVLAVFKKPKFAGKMIVAGIGIIILVAILSTTSFFQTATGAFTSRFESASEFEGGVQGTLGDRFLGGLAESLFGSHGIPIFGYGLGMGTNVGSMLLSGSVVFLIAEGEWGRLIGEMGPILGIGVILLRIGLSIKIFTACYKKIKKGDLLPWILLSFGLLNILQGQWGAPTSLGFCTLIGGLMIASLHIKQILPKH